MAPKLFLAMKEKLACALVPPLTAIVLLYQVLTDLQIAVMHDATLVIIGITLAAAAAAGLLAAFGPAVVRVGVLTASMLLFLDVTFHLPVVFDRLSPVSRTPMTRDEKRIADLHRIKSALDQYVARFGPLPTPADYGEATGPSYYWGNWWDLSSHDGDGDGAPFLDFLVEEGILPAVPVDPVNEPSPGNDPRGGKQYVYFVVPAGYDYLGGTCEPNRWHYMLGITTLEYKPTRSSAASRGSGCACLWRDQPNFFQQEFDYILCGTFDATPERLARAAEARAKRAAEALAEKQREAARIHVPQDQRRVADLHQIQQALQRYLDEIGPLPAPREYGEASGISGFWPYYWDVSGEDGDGDGNPFLDFLVDSGTMPSVPVDPDNHAPGDGDPRGGRQYVYFVASPDDTFAGGSCAAPKNQWVYMLGITDLRSEPTRPPKNIAGSGCECLWRDQPNFFQQHFDYVICGTFDRERLARAAEARVRRAAEAVAEKQRAAARIHVPKDQRRVADLHQIQQALQRHLEEIGPLPAPREYGEASNSPGFWPYYWDLSGKDGDGDGNPFLDFLVESGTMPSVPVDPDNQAPSDGDPRGGRQYVYFVVSPNDTFAGGSCAAPTNQWVYMLGITDLQSEPTRPPKNIAGSGCECLWRDQPNFFQQHFDYVICGTFDATPETLAHAAETRAKRAAETHAKQAAEALAEKEAAARIHVPQDQRRVADLLEIQQALQRYLEKSGSLPAPRDYGESERSRKPGFWQHYWDVSAEDGDDDGNAFLDFLVESGTIPSVPVDPDNEPADDGDPRGGRQYVYFVVSPDQTYQGGSCVAQENQWVYLLGITDLRSELTRPPKNIAGSGCECLWRDQPNFFQQHFDYVVCGTFSPRTP